MCLFRTRQATYSRLAIKLTAVWYVTQFHCHVWIRCIAPDSCWIGKGIAAVVLCCRATSVRKVVIICLKGNWCPLLTWTSTHSGVYCSHVLMAEMSQLTCWTK